MTSKETSGSERTVSHLLDTFYDRIGRAHHGVSGHVAGDFAPPAEVAEAEAGFELTIEVPGMAEEDLEITVRGGDLIVSGEKRDEREERGAGFYLRERRYGSFRRIFRLPADLDADKARARCAKGVLTVRVPRKPEAESGARKIPVRPG